MKKYLATFYINFKRKSEKRVWNIEKENEEITTAKKEYTAEDVAKIMVEIMKANMENPNFWNEKEELQQRVADEVIKKRKERQKKKEKLL